MSTTESVSEIVLNFMITNSQNIYQRLMESLGLWSLYDPIWNNWFYCHIENNLYQLRDISYHLIISVRLIQDTMKRYQDQLHVFEFAGFTGTTRRLISKYMLRLLLEPGFSYRRITKLLKVSKKILRQESMNHTWPGGSLTKYFGIR